MWESTRSVQGWVPKPSAVTNLTEDREWGGTCVTRNVSPGAEVVGRDLPGAEVDEVDPAQVVDAGHPPVAGVPGHLGDLAAAGEVDDEEGCPARLVAGAHHPGRPATVVAEGGEPAGRGPPVQRAQPTGGQQPHAVAREVQRRPAARDHHAARCVHGPVGEDDPAGSVAVGDRGRIAERQVLDSPEGLRGRRHHRRLHAARRTGVDGERDGRDHGRAGQPDQPASYVARAAATRAVGREAVEVGHRPCVWTPRHRGARSRGPGPGGHAHSLDTPGERDGSDAAPQRLHRLVGRRGDGARRTAQHLGDLSLGEALVVLQHEDDPLPVGERADHRPQEVAVAHDLLERRHHHLRGIAGDHLAVLPSPPARRDERGDHEPADVVVDHPRPADPGPGVVRLLQSDVHELLRPRVRGGQQECEPVEAGQARDDVLREFPLVTHGSPRAAGDPANTLRAPEGGFVG